MNSVALCGYSDDIVSIEADGKGLNETSQPCSFAFVAGGKTLHVNVAFNGKKGTGWKISTELADDSEEGDLPFDVRIIQEKYSPKLIVENATVPVSVLSRGKTLGTLTPAIAVIGETKGKDPKEHKTDFEDCG